MTQGTETHTTEKDARPRIRDERSANPRPSTENDAPGCPLEACRAGSIRAGEDPDKASCYLCRPSVIPPVEGRAS